MECKFARGLFMLKNSQYIVMFDKAMEGDFPIGLRGSASKQASKQVGLLRKTDEITASGKYVHAYLTFFCLKNET